MKSSADLGSKKLGEIFKAIRMDLPADSFLDLLCFAGIVSAKPDGWGEAIELQIERTGRRAWYLLLMRNLLLKEYKTGINRQAERDVLKRLIAFIYAKRTFNKVKPGAKLVNDVMRAIESDGTLED